MNAPIPPTPSWRCLGWSLSRASVHPGDDPGDGDLVMHSVRLDDGDLSDEMVVSITALVPV